MSFSKGSWLKKKYTKTRHEIKWKKHLVINETKLGHDKDRNGKEARKQKFFLTT